MPEVEFKLAEAAIRAALHADFFPQPGGAEVVVDDVNRAVGFVAEGIEIGAFGHVVDLRGNRQAFVGLCGALEAEGV